MLPIASAWEREGLCVGFRVDQRACEWVQLRPALVAPRGEARADTDVVFDLAVRLGLGEHFWNGDVDAGLRHHLAPTGLSLQALRAAPRGIRVPLETGAADGFNVMPPILPAQFDVFAGEVVPILQRRGLFRTEYKGSMLREHYGLPWPASVFDDPAWRSEPLAAVAGV